MAKIYCYVGISFIFRTNDHLPIHIHGKKGEYESKAELIIVDGKIVDILIKGVKGKKCLKDKDLDNFLTFVRMKCYDIREKWISFYVDGIKPKVEKYDKKGNISKSSKSRNT